MKRLIKPVKILAVLIASAAVLLFAASLILEEKVAEFILSSINKNIAIKVEAGSSRLSFIKKFPRASLILRDVLVSPPLIFNKEGFGFSADTLLYAGTVTVEFKLSDFAAGKYTIESAGARDGMINLLADSLGKENYIIAKENNSAGQDDFTIDLKRINLDNMRVRYNDLSQHLLIKGFVINGKLKTKISGSTIDFRGDASLVVNRFSADSLEISSLNEARVHVSLLSNTEGVRFDKSIFSAGRNDFALSGFVSKDNNIDLRITAENVSFSAITGYLPDKYGKILSRYSPEGNMNVECSVKGQASENSVPLVELKAELKDGRIDFGRSGIQNLSLNGSFANGSGRRSAGFVSLSDVKFDLGGSSYAGAIIIRNLERPHTELAIKGDLFPETLKKIFGIKNITEAGGSVAVDLRLVTDYWPDDTVRVDDLAGLKPEATLVFRSFRLGWKDKFLVEKVNGTLFTSDSWKTGDLELAYKGQKIRFSGEFRNLPPWLAGKAVSLSASGKINFDRFLPEAFITASSGKPGKSFPDNMVLNLDFDIGEMDYKTFSSTGIKGSLSYKPGILSFKSLDLNTLEGNITGNGFIVQNAGRSYISRCNLDITGINIRKAFTAFNNFGQEFIKAENLSGELSGNVSVLIPIDREFRPVVRQVSAEGKYAIINGGLINFDPVKQLSRFIELSELENINFQKLENDFIIRNNVLYIPQMDVKSSAADITVNGMHSFDNNYEYHVKMLLSQLLSKKKKKTAMMANEFGVIKDDGLGRTSILLKIEDKGDDVKVGYDLKAAASGIKSNMKTEKQALKTILNEEYGWYDDKTVTGGTKKENKPRFNIVWEETDSIKQ